MKRNSHLEWKVKYAPGTPLARGYNGGKEVLTDKVETTGNASAVQLTPHRASIRADREDLSVITVQVNDAQGRMVPTAGNEITFTTTGPGKIIGVGNGDPSSHEPDQFVEKVNSILITGWRMQAVENATNVPEVGFDFDDSGWRRAFGESGGGRRGNNGPTARTTVYRGSFESPSNAGSVICALELRSL